MAPSGGEAKYLSNRPRVSTAGNKTIEMDNDYDDQASYESVGKPMR